MDPKIKRMRKKLNDSFGDKLHAALAEEWPTLQVETYFDLMGTMKMVTRPVSAKKFTKQQFDYIKAFEAGYFAAKDQVFG